MNKRNSTNLLSEIYDLINVKNAKELLNECNTALIISLHKKRR